MGRTSHASDALSTKARNRLEELGANIKKARTRRGITQKDLANRVSASHVTISKLEKGNPSVGLGVLLMVLDVMGLVDDMANLANPTTDTVGIALEEAQPKKVWTRKKTKNLDF